MPTIEDVKAFLSDLGIEVLEFTQPSPTAETAAAAVGCEPAQIAKTILFIAGGEPVAVVTCGDMKVKSSKLKNALELKGKVVLPKAEAVEELTGYKPGGVCPFLLPTDVAVAIDESMRRFPIVYAAAGNANSAVPVTVEQLLEITGGVEADTCDPLG